MLGNPPILTIHRGQPRPAPGLIARFAGAQTSHLCDAMAGRGAMDWLIKPMDPARAAFAGPALTAFAYPADIVGVMGAVAEAQAGDVVVVANDSYRATAIVGDLVIGMLRNRGVAAFVTDGLARDRAGIVATGLPTFAAGISPNSPATNGPGVVGAPIICGGVLVRPGDIVVGDADGVVVIPLDQAEQVLEALAAVRAAEDRAIAAVAGGACDSEKVRRLLAEATIVG